MRQQLLQAALLNFLADKAKAEANLEVYLTNSAGIGEHPDVIKEIVDLTKLITEADEGIKYLETKIEQLSDKIKTS